MRVALHSCCGPCSIEVVDFHRGEGDEPTLVYFNPNIHPVDEYERRGETLAGFAQDADVPLRELDYDPEAWEREVGIHGDDRTTRCRACYRLRFDGVARWAAEHDYGIIATTLSISPYQDASAIREELEAAAQRHGLKARFVDHRDSYAQATRRSREAGMYRQNFCGCRFSKAEAERERQARKEARKGRA